VSTEDVPVEVKDRLPRPRPDVDEHAVVGEPDVPRGLRDELEHSLRLVRRELRDLAEALDVALRQYEQVGLGLRIDVPNRDEAVCLRDVVAFANEAAEEAVLKQRRSPPR
jgi:hypothetical protein